MPKLNKIADYIDTHPIGRIFKLGKKKTVWKRVAELKAGVKIAIEKNGKLEWDEIVSVKKVGHERVYDIEVEGTHNFVGNGILAHNTNLSLTDTGDLNISQDNSGNYQVTNTTNNSVIDRIGAFADLITANIKAGAIIASKTTTYEFIAFQGTIDNLLIKSGLVAGNIQTKLISPLADSTDVTVQIGTATESGKFAIQNSAGTEVASIDASGSAKFAGDATVSGTLYAGVIKSQSLDEIQALLTKVQTDQNLLSQMKDSTVLNATNSASLAQISTEDLYVTNQAAINSLSVSTSLTFGTDMIFGSTANSIDTLSAPLKIQSLALAPIEFMAGLVTIDTKGNVAIAGDLFVAGKVTAGGLQVADSQGVIVASIDASGSAIFSNIQSKKITGSNEDRGSVDILPAEDSKIVEREWTSSPSAVFVSTSYKTQAWVTDISDKGFTVKVSDSPLDAPEKIFWWALW